MVAKNRKNENNTFTDRPHCNEDGHPISKECIGYDDVTNIKHKKRIKRKNANEDLRPFTGLDTSAYILVCIVEGKDHDEIVAEFNTMNN